MIKVVILGSGNVGSHLFEAISHSKEAEVVQLFSRTASHLSPYASKVAVTTKTTDLMDADLYLISVPDDAIGPLSSQLDFTGKLVAHTSGSVDIMELDPKNSRAVLYPLQSFSRERNIDFSQVPLCLETENPGDLELLTRVAASISGHIYHFSSSQRRTLHLSAVFVNNFTNYLYHIGQDICNRDDIPFEVLKPLISETAQKVLTMSPLQAQTGPARRNDQTTITKHLNMIENPTYREIYQLLTTSIQKEYDREKL